MNDTTILVLLGALAALLFAAVLLFFYLWARAVDRIAAAVTRISWPDDGSIMSRTLDMGELSRVRSEVAWILDVQARDVRPRPENVGQGGQRCGVVVVLRGDCDDARRRDVLEIESAVRARLAKGVTFAIVVCPQNEIGRPSLRAA